MYLVGVQMTVTHQFAGIEQHGDLVPPAHACGRIRIDIAHLDGNAASRRQRGERAVKVIAEMTARAGIQHEVRRVSDAAVRRRRPT